MGVGCALGDSMGFVLLTGCEPAHAMPASTASPALVLFVHSTGTGPFMWSRHLADLPVGLAPLTPANLGYSPATALPAGQASTVADEVAHLRAQIPEGTEAVHLGGHSYGGLVAMSLAQALAAEGRVAVRSLWLYEPVLFAPLKADEAGLPPDVAREVAWLYSDPLFLREDHGGSEAWLQGFVDYWNQPGAWAALPDKARAMARQVGWKMFQEVRCVAREAQDFAHYRFAIPLTLVRGEHTTPPAREMLHRLATVNPHAEVTVLPGVGHMGVVSATEAVGQSLRAHWQRALA
jgi:pimeloyl-ACP methyl ester carboxylesterase